VVLGAGCRSANRDRRGAYCLLPARRRPRLPHVLHDGPWQRDGRYVAGPARHDAVRPPRGVGGQPRGLAGGPGRRLAGRWTWRADLLVLAHGRRGRTPLGSYQPAYAAMDPPRRDPRGNPRPPGRPPLTRGVVRQVVALPHTARFRPTNLAQRRRPA